MSEQSVIVYSVGQPFPRPIPAMDGIYYEYAHGDHTITCFCADLLPVEVDAFRRGEIAFELLVYKNVIDLSFDIPGIFPWADAPYSIHLQGEEPPTYGEGEHATVTLILVHTTSGRVAALRYVTLSPAFTQALAQALALQYVMPRNDLACAENVEDLYGLPWDHLKSYVVAACKGGD